MASSNPDLLVTFMVFSRDGKVQGDFEDDGAFIDDTEEFKVKDGSLLISGVGVIFF